MNKITMRGELYFNGSDADDYGIIMGNGCYAALICPPPAKDYVVSESRCEHGKRYMASSSKMNERTIQMQLYIKARSRSDMYTKLTRFSAEILESGAIKVTTRYQSNVAYNCIYKSCSQLSEFNGRAGKFLLQLVEPDPSNRS